MVISCCSRTEEAVGKISSDCDLVAAIALGSRIPKEGTSVSLCAVGVRPSKSAPGFKRLSVSLCSFLELVSDEEGNTCRLARPQRQSVSCCESGAKQQLLNHMGTTR